jgi:hypothetical protein
MNWQDYCAAVIVLAALSYLVVTMLPRKKSAEEPGCPTCGVDTACMRSMHTPAEEIVVPVALLRQQRRRDTPTPVETHSEPAPSPNQGMRE